MKKKYPVPGDLIIVEQSEWYGCPDGGMLRVCEGSWFDPNEGVVTAPRSQVSTFWGPGYGQSDGIKHELMSTSGGPFKAIKFTDIDGIELVGKQDDTFWCWLDQPRAGGGMDRIIEVDLWRLPLLIDAHHRELVAYGLREAKGDNHG